MTQKLEKQIDPGTEPIWRHQNWTDILCGQNDGLLSVIIHFFAFVGWESNS